MTLDLDGVRRLVVGRDITQAWPSACLPYAEHALRVEARVAAAGGGDDLRMVALLHRYRWLATGGRRRSLVRAGVPSRILDLVDVLAYDRFVPAGEHARRIREAGLEIVCRADLHEQDAAMLLPLVRVLVELDVTDPERRPDPPELLRRLAGPAESLDWWHAVLALGRLRVAAAVTPLAALYGRAAGVATERFRASHLRTELTRIVTGKPDHHRYEETPEPSYLPELLHLTTDRSPQVRDIAVRLLSGATADATQFGLLRRTLATGHDSPTSDPPQQPTPADHGNATAGDTYAGSRWRGMPAGDEVAAVAAQVLGRSRATEAVGDLAAVLSDRHRGYGGDFRARADAVTLRQEAATALGRIGDPAAVDALAAALNHDPDDAVRAAAADALGEIGGDRAVTALLRQDDPPALRVLGRLRVREAVPGLLRLLRARPGGWESMCADALASIGAREAVGDLAGVVIGGDPRHRLAATRAITAIDPDVALDAVLAAANDTDHRVRRQAAVALCRCRSRDPRILAGMTTVLAVGPGQRLVLRALTERPEPAAEQALFALFRSTDNPAHRRRAAQALLALAPLAGGLACRVEAELGTAGDPRLPHLAWLLGELGDRRAAPPPARLLDHRTASVRAAAASAMARLLDHRRTAVRDAAPPVRPSTPGPALSPGDHATVDQRLAAAATDPSPRVRSTIVLAFGARGLAADRPRIAAALDDPHPGVRAAAAEALRRSHHATGSVPDQLHDDSGSPG